MDDSAPHLSTMPAAPETLRDRIRAYSGMGFVVVAETATSAQLLRRRRFNPLEFLAMPVYLVEYIGQRDRSVYLSVDRDGRIQETGSGAKPSGYQRLQGLPAPARLAIAGGLLVALAIAALALRAITG